MGSKKELQAAIAVLGLCMLVFGCTKTAESENSKKQVKIGVAVYNEEDVYVSKICGYLEDEIFQYEKDHPGVEIRKKIADARGQCGCDHRQSDAGGHSGCVFQQRAGAGRHFPE